MQSNMTQKNQSEQGPSSQHVESNDPEKDQPQVVIPQERQSVIRRKVHHRFATIYLRFCLLLTSLIVGSCQLYVFYTFYLTWIEVRIPNSLLQSSISSITRKYRQRQGCWTRQGSKPQ